MPDLSELYTLPQMAEALATPGFNKDQTLNQLKGFVKSDLLHTTYAVGTAKTAPRLYTRAMVAIAAVLHELTVMGVADVGPDKAKQKVVGDVGITTTYPPGALRSASIAMYSWHIEEDTAEWTPAQWVEFTNRLPKDGPMGQAVSIYLSNQAMREHFTWDFQLHVFAHTNFNWQRVFRGYVYDAKSEQVVLPGPETGLIPRSAIIIALDPLFERIFRDLKKVH